MLSKYFSISEKSGFRKPSSSLPASGLFSTGLFGFSFPAMFFSSFGATLLFGFSSPAAFLSPYGGGTLLNTFSFQKKSFVRQNINFIKVGETFDFFSGKIREFT
jgi:hypothetical protein